LSASSNALSEAQQFKSQYAYVDKFEDIMQAITEVIDNRFDDDCGLIISGEAGVGKTVVAKRFLKDNAEPDTDEKDGTFGIFVEIGVNGFESLYTDMLKQLHCKDENFKSVGAKKKRVIDLINELDVKVAFIDEAQEGLPGAVLPSSSYIRLLKEFTNKTNCSWVLLGPQKVKKIADVDEQMGERFSNVLSLKAFNCNSNADTEEFMEYLFALIPHTHRKAKYFDCLNKSLTENGDDFEYKDDVSYDNLLRFLLATRGKPRRIARLLMESIKLTKAGGRISSELLGNSYKNKYRIDKDRRGKWFNPFKSSMPKVIEELKEWGLYA